MCGMLPRAALEGEQQPDNPSRLCSYDEHGHYCLMCLTAVHESVLHWAPKDKNTSSNDDLGEDLDLQSLHPQQ